MDVNPGFKYIEKYHGGLPWYMMESNIFFQVFVSN